jgi:hypothetical protein
MRRALSKYYFAEMKTATITLELLNGLSDVWIVSD